jgi:threonylcarbamoyladenosine tRNA methylthiotransferase MtaB
VHVFPYSPRPGTADADADPVPAEEKRRRAATLRRLSDLQGRRHRRAKRGRRERVLVETPAGRGYADDYTAFLVPGAPVGEIVTVLAGGTAGDAVTGVVTGP